ncbi:MAG: HEAT repeat domain-containing protein, partial [Gemmataceae bacterium]
MRSAGVTGVPVVIHRLTEVVREGRGDTEGHAIIALGNFGKEARSAAPALASALAEGRMCRSVAAEALIEIGEDAKEAIPALTRALSAPDPEVAEEAVRVIGPPTAADAPGLVEALDSRHWPARFAAARFLSRLGAGHGRAAAVLREGLES